MKLPCEYAVKVYLPHLRARVVKRLVEESGWSVYEAARALRVSATAAAKYKRLSSVKPKLYADEVEELAEDLASRIAGGILSAEEFVNAVCSLCAQSRLGGDLCKIHAADFPELARCTACAGVFTNAAGVATGRGKVLRELEEALGIVSASREFASLVPEVRTNIAAAAEPARGLADIAAFPGRLTVVKDKVVALAPPEFGASRHMASVLLAAKRVDPSVGAVTCLRFTRAVEEAAEKLGLTRAAVDRERFSSVVEFVASLSEIPDFIADPGGPGIEPVAYIFGSTAPDAAEKAVKIAELAASST